MIRRFLRAAALVAGGQMVAAAGTPPGEPVAFADLPGIAGEDFATAFVVFRASCSTVVGDVAPQRAGVSAGTALRASCRDALAAGLPINRDAARGFFERWFEPRRLTIPGFFTGYFEPVAEGSPTRTAGFTTPLLALPAGLVPRGSAVADRRLPDGTLVPVPDRAGIETGALGADAVPLVWLREPIDAFIVQVQGSARVALPDGRLRRVAYAGRNGYPYTSIGKLLVQTLGIPPDRMGLADLKSWVRAHGQGPGEAGTALMRQNRSYIFFRFDDGLPPEAGPIGAAGVSLTTLRSLAIDRSAWPYGLPFYVDADLPWDSGTATPLRRIMIAQDTGSAIVGPARADIFFGTGAAAASRAGPIRHPGTLFVLWPRERPDPGVAGDEAKKSEAIK